MRDGCFMHGAFVLRDPFMTHLRYGWCICATQAAQARLDALERDNAEDDKMFGMASDDEDFNVDESSDDGMLQHANERHGLQAAAAVLPHLKQLRCLCSLLLDQRAARRSGEGRGSPESGRRGTTASRRHLPGYWRRCVSLSPPPRPPAG